MDAAVPLPGSALKNDADATMIAEQPPWFRWRGYPHFDRPLDAVQAAKIATDPEAVSKRSFLPFLAFDVNQRRSRTQADGSRKTNIKRRPVAFASHVDAAIFSYYAYLLKDPYERTLTKRGLSKNIIAYRRFDPAKCNIHFANEAFAEIESRKNCVAVALDIEKFFDTIPHDTLKQIWTIMLDQNMLPPDHYAVFKAVTRWAKSDQEQVFKALEIGRRRRENWQRPDTLCTPGEFRDKIRKGGLISPGYGMKNGKPVGIPQGSPISAVLSNLVMLEIDTAVVNAANTLDVYYRRYSDDILLIGSPESVAAVEKIFCAETEAIGLDINHGKTNRVVFGSSADGLLDASDPLQYLGFVFDGKRVLVRPQTMAKFIQRMKRGVRSAKRASRAARRQGRSGNLRRQELYARYSHLGPTSEMLERAPSSNLRNNFYTYAVRSSRQMDRAEIKRQLRKHWTRLNAEIELADKTN